MTGLSRLLNIHERASVPDSRAYTAMVEECLSVLEHENPAIRPPDSSGFPGGLLELPAHVPAVIVPDLHARTLFFLAIMESRPFGSGTLYELLASGNVIVLCLGDGFHAESRARERWSEALEEYIGGFTQHRAMDGEMRESLGLMEMVMHCKISFPDHFHFLKGNHENVLNEEGNGNHAFRKFALEGEMVLDWLVRYYGEDFVHLYARFEKALPLAAVSGEWMASHAEPHRFYSRQELIEARLNADTIAGLSWTDNGAAQADAVGRMIAAHLPGARDPVYFGGHRPVSQLYSLRAGGLFVQIHNPSQTQIARIRPGSPFTPDLDIVRL